MHTGEEKKNCDISNNMTWKTLYQFEFANEEACNGYLDEDSCRPPYPVPVKVPGWHFSVNPTLSCTCVPLLDAATPYQVYNDASNKEANGVLSPGFEDCPTAQECPNPDVPVSQAMPLMCPPSFESGIVFQEQPGSISPLDPSTQMEIQRNFMASDSRKETWSFQFPKDLCGRLIGKGGQNIKRLMKETGTIISIADAKQDIANPVLEISGQKEEIFNAVEKISWKFSDLKLSKIGESRVLPQVKPTGSLTIRQLQLPKNEVTDAVITNIIDAGHFFLHVVDLSTQMLLDDLQKQINSCYSKFGIPKIGSLPDIGTYCIVKNKDNWFRAQVIQRFDSTHQVEVVLVDHGFVIVSPISLLRKIRSDLLEVPFQAVECCLAHIVPKKDEVSFSSAALELLMKLTDGEVVEVVTRKTQFGIPYVELYSWNNNQGAISINRRLAEEGVVCWSEL